MRIGELARRSGVSERMLRYYEQQGLLRPARTEARYRDYGQAELQAVQRIKLLSESGIKLNAVKVLLPCMVDGPEVFDLCDDIVATLREEVRRLDEKLDALTESRRIVANFLAVLDGAAQDPRA